MSFIIALCACALFFFLPFPLPFYTTSKERAKRFKKKEEKCSRNNTDVHRSEGTMVGRKFHIVNIC